MELKCFQILHGFMTYKWNNCNVLVYLNMYASSYFNVYLIKRMRKNLPNNTTYTVTMSESWRGRWIRILVNNI